MKLGRSARGTFPFSRRTEGKRKRPSVRSTLIVLLIVASQAIAEEPVAPTAFEAYVARPTVVIDLLRSVGSFESSDAKAEVAVLIASDTANPGEQMRGLRLSLENNTTADRLYLDAHQIALAQSDLAEIEGGIAELEADSSAPYRVQGTASCWMPERPMRILCPSYRVGPDGAGFSLAAYGGPGFGFPERRPSELKALIDQAAAALVAP